MPLFVTEFGYSSHKSSKTVGPWSREIYILHYVVRGECAFSGFTVSAGQSFLIAKGLRHGFVTSDEYEHFWIGFNGNAAEKVFEVFGLDIRLHQLLFPDDGKFAETLFYNVLERLKNGKEEILDTVVCSVLMSMLPLLKKEKSSEDDRGVNYAEKARIFIETNYAHPIKMSETAKEIHITEKYMYRLFTDRYGMSPQQFLVKTRMEAAEKMLIEREMSVKEVSLSVGYSSLPSFSKTFKKYFGFSPAALRSRSRSDSSMAEK